MFILKKLFQLRGHVHTDSEKPFLDHLEDLRKALTKMILTLVVAVLACWSLQGRLMKILRAPADSISRAQAEEQLPDRDKLPVQLTVDDWEQAKKVERAALPLSPPERQVYYGALNDPRLAFHAKVAGLLRSALTLPEERRDAYLQSLSATPDTDPAGAHSAVDIQAQVRALIGSKASPEIDSKVGDMSTLKPTESFMLSMKLACFAGIVVSFPLLLYFLLEFILPGLHGHERRVLWPALGIGFGLFISGVLFAYFLILPRALLFFADWGKDMGISNDWRIGEYISFATQFTLLFGASFELPVVVMVCVKLGLLGYTTMAKTRRYAIVAILIIAAVLTPTPDIMTQMLMACPMIILYEACIWLAWWDEKKAKKAEEAEARERMERLLLHHDTPNPYATEEGEHGEPVSTEEIPRLHHDDRAADPDREAPAKESESSAGGEDAPLPPPATREEPRQE